MAKTITEKMNGFGVSLRFILPVMLTICFTFLIRDIDSVKKGVDELKLHFTNHLSHHKAEEDKNSVFREEVKSRLVCIETKLGMK
jgi:hypothetical protein